MTMSIEWVERVERVEWVECWLNVSESYAIFAFQNLDIIMGKNQGLILNACIGFVVLFHWWHPKEPRLAHIGNQGPLVVVMMPSTRSLASETNCEGHDCFGHIQRVSVGPKKHRQTNFLWIEYSLESSSAERMWQRVYLNCCRTMECFYLPTLSQLGHKKSVGRGWRVFKWRL